MEKHLKAIDLTEHPEKYTENEIQELLNDPEIREIYDILCDIDSALKPVSPLSEKEVEDEWQRFCQKEANVGKRKKATWWIRNQRVAAVAMIAVPAIAALALGTGILIKKSIKNNERPVKERVQNSTIPLLVDAVEAKDSSTTVTDSLTQRPPMVFENEPLGNILIQMTQLYGLQLVVKNKTSLNMRLFFKWNPSSPPEDIVRQLNNFERINLTLSEGNLILE